MQNRRVISNVRTKNEDSKILLIDYDFETQIGYFRKSWGVSFHNGVSLFEFGWSIGS